MAPTRKVKQLEGIKNKLNNLYGSINFEELNYGEIMIDNKSNFILNKEEDLDEIIDILNTFKDDLLNYKESYLSQKTTEKLMSLLQNDDENAELLKQIINNDIEKTQNNQQKEDQNIIDSSENESETNEYNTDDNSLESSENN